MANRILEALREELSDWRARADELLVQANLGKMELRDRVEEAQKAFDKAHSQAKRKLGELREGGEEELDAVKQSVEAGWEELRRTYRQLSEKKKA